MERDSESAYLDSLSAKHGPSWSIRGFFLVIGVLEAFSLECYCRKLGIETDLGVIGVVRSVTVRFCVTTSRYVLVAELAWSCSYFPGYRVSPSLPFAVSLVVAV